MSHNIICFGDSNTYGYDPRSYLGGRYPASIRWTGLLKSAGWKVSNEGENGRCIPGLAQEAARLAQMVRRAEADTVVIMLGSNDLFQQAVPSAEACTERMEHFLTALMKEIPAFCKILLIAPPPMRMGTWVTELETLEESYRLAGCYRVLAKKLKIEFADAGAWDIDLTFDGVHFSERGHLAFARGLQKMLE